MKNILLILCMLLPFNFSRPQQDDPGDRIVALDFSADANLYATGNGDQSVCIWDVTTHELQYEVRLSDLRRYPNDSLYRISRVVFSPDGERVAASLWGDIGASLITIIDTATGEIMLEIPTPASINTIDWSSDGNLIAAIYNFEMMISPGRSNLGVWDANTGVLINEQRLGETSPLSMDWNPVHTQLAYTTHDQVVVWDVEQWQELYRITDTQDFISVCWSPSGDMLAAVGDGNILRVWDGITQQELQEFSLPDGDALARPRLFWSGTSVVVTFADHIDVWDTRTGEHIFSYIEPEYVVNAAVMTEGHLLYFTPAGVETLEF
jgi:WD40 repeat protein